MEAVVDGQGEEGPSALGRPAGGEVQESDGVAAPGQGQGDGRATIGIEPPVEGGPAYPLQGISRT
jgi:hypothetical protein